ncbi:hypothetical protein [Lactococcus lactis]|uniref:hypothetical protein n=1 Tax=Lactococcus lactis TaxID=1358 RepID=UPI003D13542E
MENTEIEYFTNYYLLVDTDTSLAIEELNKWEHIESCKTEVISHIYTTFGTQILIKVTQQWK